MKVRDLAASVETLYDGLDSIYEAFPEEQKAAALELLGRLDELLDMLSEQRDNGDENEPEEPVMEVIE